MKWGRNDPCPCGSGKKYKDCCLENRVADFQQHKWQRLAHELQDNLFSYAEEERFIPDSEEAFQVYLNIIAEDLFEPLEEPVFVSFVDWFIHDYTLKSQGKSLIRCYLVEKERELGPMEKELLQSWADSHISLLRVLAVGEEWLVLEDLLVGGEYLVQESNLAQGIVSGSILLARLIKVGDNFQLSGAALEFTPLLREEILALVTSYYISWQEDNRGKAWKEFLKQEGFKIPSLIAAVMEGEEASLPRLGAQGQDKGGEEGDQEWPEAQQLVTQILEQYYRRWVDLSVPAFSGKTPREMCRTPEGRQKVENLLKDLEQLELKRRDNGEPYFDFNNVRSLLGIKTNKYPGQRFLDSSYREVSRLLEENGDNKTWVSTAKRVWYDFYQQARPQVKKANAWAAAVIYTMARLFSERDITQKDLAHRYQVAPGTISNHYRTIWQTLNLKRFDQRYTR